MVELIGCFVALGEMLPRRSRGLRNPLNGGSPAFSRAQLCAFDIEIIDQAALFHGEAPDACGIRLPAHASCRFPPLAFWSWDFVRGRACFHKGFRR
jgi:hypothetical protein